MKEEKTVEKKNKIENKPLINANPPAYPSSSKNKKDWSKIDAEIDDDIVKNKDDYGEADPLNGLFKTIYKNADENTRKAMIKSY